ncbi:MAG: 3-hydroxyacyl-CoA dehydrogenase family protein [Desulfocucumaceae bacterium]
MIRNEKVAVIGSGTMGGGIAQVFAQSGFSVCLVDTSAEALKAAEGRIRQNMAVLAGEGMLNAGLIEESLGRITFTGELDVVRQSGYVVEVIPENLAIKQALFKKLAGLAGEEAILATNTSGISITAIASAVDCPGRVIGMHWWNPPHIIPVIEVICGEKTSPRAVEKTSSIIGALGKKTVLVRRDVPGFLGNRLQYALMREAIALLQAGVASAEDIDLMVKEGFGFKFPILGPLETIDMAGLDIYTRVSSYLYKDLDGSAEVPAFLLDMVDRGDLGLKAGRGFYDYSGVDLQDLARQRTKKLIGLLKAVKKED